MKEKKRGICYLVGAGPGDPGLLTIKAKDCLSRAEVVVYDYLSNPEFLRFAPESAEVLYVGKKAGAHTLKQEEIDKLLVERTGQGKIVVRLKGGDPFLFGRGGEEAEALVDAGLAFEIVPGVSSAIAGPAYAGIPVTHRDHNAMLTIFTGHEEPGKEASGVDWKAVATAPGTKVMLMGVERMALASKELIAHGMSPETPVAMVRWASTGRQETLVSDVAHVAAEIEKKKFAAPAVAVFGGVVGLRERLNWFETRPLFGKRIAVTRTRQQAGELVDSLRVLGADAYELPTIRIEPAPNRKEFYELVADAHTYDWLVFTSPNGVDAFFRVFYEIFDDARCLGMTQIAAIGPATAARVRHYRFAVDVMPERYIAEEIIEALQEKNSVENLKFLLPRAEKAREALPDALAGLGAIVDEVVAYRTVPETEDVSGGMRRFREEGADFVTFTSSSTAENFHALGLPWPEGCKTASIGPITSNTLREFGYSVDVEAQDYDIPGLVKAILFAAEKIEA